MNSSSYFVYDVRRHRLRRPRQLHLSTDNKRLLAVVKAVSDQAEIVAQAEISVLVETVVKALANTAGLDSFFSLGEHPVHNSRPCERIERRDQRFA